MNGEWTEMKTKTKQKHILIVRLELFAFVCDSQKGWRVENIWKRIKNKQSTTKTKTKTGTD